VRRSGTSFAHPLLVLIIQTGDGPYPRFAVTAGTSVGNAVRRNRAKRLLRAALSQFIKRIDPNVKGVLVARKPLAEADFSETCNVLESLLIEAGIITSN
jgi:ribonuclease P protein component